MRALGRFDAELVVFTRSFLVTALVAGAACAQATDPRPRATPQSQGVSARRLGLGVAVRQAPGVAGVMGSPDGCHWHGAAGSLAWFEPRENRAVVFMAQTPGPIRFQNRRTHDALVYQALN